MPIWKKRKPGPEPTPEPESEPLRYELASQTTYGVGEDPDGTVWITEERFNAQQTRVLHVLLKVERDSVPFIHETIGRYLDARG